jgi:hypothetical protein
MYEWWSTLRKFKETWYPRLPIKIINTPSIYNDPTIYIYLFDVKFQLIYDLFGEMVKPVF